MDESNDRTPETDDALADEPNDATAGDSVTGDATESMEDAAPVVGGAADLGEPYTPVGETFQTSASVPADEVPPETGVAILQEPDADEALGSTVDAIGSGPTHLVNVPVDEEEPLAGVELAVEPADDMDAVGTAPASEPDAAPETTETDEELEVVEAIEDEATEAAVPESDQDVVGYLEPTVEPIEAEQLAEADEDADVEVAPVGDAAAPAAPATTDEAPAAAAATDEPAASETAEERKERRARNPMRGPGDWYVVHTYAGYENKVKTNLESRIHTMQMEEKIFDVHIPMEDVMEIKGGKKQVVQRKVFPGYLLVKMVYDNDSWYVVRNTPGVTGFVASGTGSKPTPLSRREVEKILAVKKEEVKPQFRLGFEENDVVRIISGPFADFNGTISEINLDQSKLKVLVNIFDRETPVELSFDQVAKV
jgi:transcription termination/antitermination protein NusG